MEVLNKYKDDITGAIYGGRPTPFGNPFSSGTRDDNIERFRNYFLIRVERDATFREHVLSLKGANVYCYCHPKPCHLDVIKEWLDNNDS